MSKRNTIIIACVLVKNSEGKALVLRRSNTDPFRPLTWDLPGGLTDFGEDPTLGAIREADEEAGLKLNDITISAVISVLADDEYVIRMIFRGHTIIGNDDVVLSYEHDQYKWVTKAELAALNMPDKFKAATLEIFDLF